MLALEIIIGVPFAVLLLLLLVAGRLRGLHRAGGAVELSLRLRGDTTGRGWVNGIGRFVGDELRWYRVFSLSPRPRRTLSRRDLRVTGRRSPADAERRALQAGAVVLSCCAASATVDLAMQPSTVTGFLAWLEAQPPGATLPV